MENEVVYIRSTGIFDDSRATKEIIALCKTGYVIHVLSWDRYGNASDKNSAIFKGYSNVDFYYFKKRVPNGIGIKNIFKLIVWFFWVSSCLKTFKNIRIVYTCNLDTVIPVLKYCRRRKCKLVYDIFDYYVDSHNIPSFLRNCVESQEIKAINRAELTIICTEERREQLAKAQPNNVVVIYNSPNVERRDDNDNSFDYVYCGSLSSRRLIEEILDLYPSYSNYKLYFAGYGQYAEQCDKVGREYSNFTYSQPIPYQKVLEIESKASCISAIYEPTIRNHRLCAPNKFYEALALSKPVIVCKGTGIDTIVKENDIGIVINYDAKEFYDALTWIKANPIEAKTMGAKGRLLYEQKYLWSRMEEIIVAEIMSLSGKDMQARLCECGIKQRSKL